MLSFVIIPVYAADPLDQFTFQGVLKDSGDNLVTATKDVTLEIFTTLTGGSALWTETHDDVSVSDGIFTIYAGSVNSFADDLNFTDAYFLQVTVANSDGSSPEILSPRIKIAGAPFSLSSSRASVDFDVNKKNVFNATSVNATALEISQTGTSLAANITNTGTGDSFRVNDVTGDSTPFLIDNAGNIGIGTTSPAELLHLKNSTGDVFIEIERGSDTLFAATEYVPVGPLNIATKPQYGVGLTPSLNDFFIWASDGVTDAIRATLNTSGMWIFGNNMFTKGSGSIGDISLDNGNSADTPGIKFYNGTNTNFGIDVTSGEGLRFVANLDEPGEVARMVVDHSGKVGIGTTTPTHTLNVVGDLNVTENLTVDTDTLFADSINNRVGIRTNSPQYMLDMGINTFVSIEGLFGHIIQHNSASSQFWTLATRNNGNFGIGTSTTDPRPGGNIITSTNDKITITPTGNVGIGTTSPTIDFAIGDTDTGFEQVSDGVLSFRRDGLEIFRFDNDVPGQAFQFNVANALGGNSCETINEVLETNADGTLRCGTEDSDERLKNVLARDVLYGLEEIKNTELIQYTWNDLSGHSMDNGIKAYQGFSAQNMLNVTPELVFTGYDGYYGLDKNGLIATSWNGIKELDSKVQMIQEQQQAQIEQQQSQIEQLQAEIDELKSLVCLDHPNAVVCRR